MNPSTVIELPIGWILGAIGTLCVVISTLAGLIYTNLSGRLVKQDAIIQGLQRDVERMSMGCGASTCHWRTRLLPAIHPPAV